jgi:cyclopropane-fatty-acyl-phospholipid synthase
LIERALAFAIELTERGLVPDALVRAGVRRICADRLRESRAGGEAGIHTRRHALLESMRTGPIALVPEKANEQHYEAPVELFQHALGPHLKYSCGYWPEGVATLAEAEAAALIVSCERAQIADGQDILELGCGWGSLSLWMAERYPTSRILAVSNSHRQRQFILGRAAERGLTNLEVVTADINEFMSERRFDRVVSVEMFEHMHNYRVLLERIAGLMRPDARLFIHIFCHRTVAYPYETDGAGNWMGRHFFTGGLMPSADLLLDFQDHAHVTARWHWNGTHYEKTANAWLANLDASRAALLPVFERAYGARDAKRWFERWRVFFMACAELFGYDRGHEWLIGHYLLARGQARAAGRRENAA